jgi:chloramphenicol O-acetyltransferase type A
MNMTWTPIDRSAWNREEYFDHYLNNTPCTYSMTTQLDVTAVKASGKPFYATLLYALSCAVNSMEQFRTALGEGGQPGVFDEMHPAYTVFHKDTCTFSSIWTAYTPDYQEFCKRVEEDIKTYGDVHHFQGKPDVPANTFPVSMIPWESFTGFNLNLQKDFDYLLPIITMGKYKEEQGKLMMPLAVQVHHSVCDGYHLCQFVQQVRDVLNQLFPQ